MHDFGFPPAGTMAAIGFQMGSDLRDMLEARRERAQHQANIQATVNHANGIIDNLWQSREKLRRRLEQMIDQHNALVDRFNTLAEGFDKRTEAITFMSSGISDLTSQFKETLRQQDELTAQLAHANERAAALKQELATLQRRCAAERGQARKSGAMGFAAYVLYRGLAGEIERKGEADRYRSLAPEARTRLGNWAQVVFANSGRRGFMPDAAFAPGIAAPEVMASYDWAAALPGAEAWSLDALHSLARFTLREDGLADALEDPAGFVSALARSAVDHDAPTRQPQSGNVVSGAPASSTKLPSPSPVPAWKTLAAAAGHASAAPVPASAWAAVPSRARIMTDGTSAYTRPVEGGPRSRALPALALSHVISPDRTYLSC